MTSPAKTAGGRQRTWTREKIIERIQRWVELYGEPPRAADWSPASARWSGAKWRTDRYRAGDPRTGEPWPSLNAAKAPFDGSLNRAIEAAGFEANRPGPPSRRSVASPDVDESMVMDPRARARLGAAEAEVREKAARIRSLEGQLERARNAAAGARAELATVRSRPVPKPAVKTKTRVVKERVRVQDTRAIKRLEVRLDRAVTARADAEALARAEVDRGRAALRDLSRARARAEDLDAQLSDAARQLSAAERERDTLEDRLTAAERRAAVPRVEVREVEVRSASDQEVLDARAAVDRAQAEAQEAEVRAARAERELRETVALVTGEPRHLTDAERGELRRGGPSGPSVLAAALKQLAYARAREPGRIGAALTAVASAAVRWRDAL